MNEQNNINDDFVEISSEEETIVENPEAAEDLKKQEQRKESIEAIKRFAEDEGGEDDEKISFRKVMGGDILMSKFFLNQVIFIVFCVILLLLYTGNRYGSLQDLIRIDSLSMEYEQKNSKVLSQASKLLNKKRQSSVERKLIAAGDTMMLNNNLPPFALPKEKEADN